MSGRKTLWAMAVASLMLGGCGTFRSAPEPAKIDIGDPPAAGMVPCADPQEEPPDIPALVGREKEDLASADRANFVDCGWRHWLLIQHVRAQQAAFAQAGAGA